jgi:hypothetical protein
MKRFLSGSGSWYVLAVFWAAIGLVNEVANIFGYGVENSQAFTYVLLTLGLGYLQDIKDTQSSRVVVRIERDEAE